MAEFLPLDGDDPNDTGQIGNRGTPIITEPIQTHRAPRRPKKPRKKKPNGPGGKKGGNKKGVRVNPPPQSFTKVRFRRRPYDTHSVIVSFDQPKSIPSRIEVQSIGEDGTSYPMNIIRATANGKDLLVDNYNLLSLPKSKSGDRQEIEIFTNNPVIDKAFSVRFFEE